MSSWLQLTLQDLYLYHSGLLIFVVGASVICLLSPSTQSSAAAKEKQPKKGENKLPSPAQALELIKARRSIFPKDYDAGAPPVPKTHVDQILEAANWAPTHGKTGKLHALQASREGLFAT